MVEMLWIYLISFTELWLDLVNISTKREVYYRYKVLCVFINELRYSKLPTITCKIVFYKFAACNLLFVCFSDHLSVVLGWN